jgi:hypothetical protein
MKAEMVKRFFRAIASDDRKAISQLMALFVEQERQNGHTQLAKQLEDIIKTDTMNTKTTSKNQSSLIQPPISARSKLPLVTVVDREKLGHHMILPEATEKRFQRIEKEYAARDRLAHYGLPYKQKNSVIWLPRLR